MSYKLIDANALAEKYPEVNDMPCIYADLDEKGLDNKHHFVSAGISDEQKNCYVLAWANKELELAFADLDKEEDEAVKLMSKACIESAMRCYRTLVADNHSGTSMGITKQIINRLISVKPLTAIEDTEDVWTLVDDAAEKDNKKYQSTRLPSLFKTVDKEGNVTYNDNNRVVCRNILNGDRFYYGFVSNLIDKLVPITMPYNPSDKAITVYVKDFTLGDYHYLGIYNAILPGRGQIDINKFTKINKKANIATEMEQGEFEKILEDHKDVILKDIV